jgi:hypothetical protein
VLEMQRYLLPESVRPGSVVRMMIVHDVAEEERRSQALLKVSSELRSKKVMQTNKILK